MPAKVKVKIIAGRNLPVMDKSNDTTDAYVEMKLGGTTYKTDVCRKSLHPQWNSEWYRFEVDDSELQDEPLQLRLMDHDTYSSNDAIGKVYLDLNPLLIPTASGKYSWNGDNNTNHEHPSNAVMSGWIPVYDTMHGIRGEVNIIVKVELFSDFNRFRQSSCGIQFFSSKSVPSGYFAQTVHGFVEELVVNDDPEYKWIDKIRTPRASNEARQTLFIKLSGELQRKIGVKALDLGGNAVIGYCHNFDLEGESGIVARGIGTAVTLVRMIDVPHANTVDCFNEERALSYIKFLGSFAEFRLGPCPTSIQPRPVFGKIFPTPLYPPLSDLAMPNLSHNKDLKQALRSHSNPVLNECIHSPSVTTLLQQEDMRGTPSYGLGRKIKNLKYSSQNMLSKKMTALKAKLGDGGIGEELDEDAISLKSESDTMEGKRRKRFKFKRQASDSSVMAELLARSVINAHNSLTCILESQDSQPSDNEQNYAENDADEPDETTPQSHLNIPTTSLDSQSSIVSSSSSESSTSDDDYEYDTKDDANFDTVSNIVKDVEILEQEYNTQANSQKVFSKQLSLPALPLNDIEANSFIDPFIFPTDNSQIQEISFKSISEKELYQLNEDVLDKEFDTTPEIRIETLPVTIVVPDKQAPLAKLEFGDTSSEEERGTVEQLHSVSSEPIPIPKKFIIPPIKIGADINHQGLMKTAMQTMLLEKVKMIGTYTPPMSPTSVTSNKSPASSTCSSPSFQQLTSTPGPIARSSTVVSLTDWNLKHDTVLGAPFTSMCSIDSNFQRQQSHPVLSDANTSKSQEIQTIISEFKKEQSQTCFSDSELHKPKNESPLISLKRTNLPSHRASRNKFIFTNLLGKSHDTEGTEKPSLKRGVSHDHLHKNKFTFLHLSRRKSHDPATNLKKIKSDELHKGRFYFLHRQNRNSESGSSESPKTGSISNIFHRHDKSDKDKDKEKFKKHGLLGTALGNVVMETVQDILATSHADKKKETEQRKLCPGFPSSSILTCTNDNSALPNPVEQPPTTGIEKGTMSGNNLHASLTPSLRNTSSSVPDTQPAHHQPEPGHQRTESVGAKILSPAKLNNVSCIHRRSSDSDLSITPKGNSLTGSDRSTANANAHLMRTNVLFRTNVPQENFDMLEYPFLTMTKYPPGFIQKLGGAVSARSVKLLERISNFEEPESRDTWWSEIRMEIRSHARALNCNAVLGYSETTAICEDVCVLSASGTAAVIGFQYTGEMGDGVSGLPIMPKLHNPVIVERSDAAGKEKNQKNVESKHLRAPGESPVHDVFGTDTFKACSICHMPYNTNNVPIRATMLKCGLCRSSKVPDVIIATIEPPDGIPTIGRGCFIQSFVHRQLKDTKSESNAKEISDGLPFLEYELHRLLINKLKIKGMNAIFGLNIKISVGEKVVVALATGTAVFLTPLPSPVLPKLVSDRSSDEKRLADLQKLLSDTVKRNRETYQLKQMDDCPNGRVMSDDESDDEQTSIDLSLGNKDCCVLQVDDPEDAEVLNLLMEERPPDGFHVVSTEQVPGLEDLEMVKTIQMFTQIYRTKFQQTGNFYKQFHRLLKTVFFKLRRIVPCALCDLEFYVELPEPDEIQLFVLGTVLGLGDPQKTKLKRKNTASKKNEDDLIFNLEEDQIPENSVVTQNYLTAQQTRHRQKSPLRNKLSIVKPRNVSSTERDFVDLTSLSYIPGGKIEHYLGHLNFFFIRETTSIREEGGLSGFIHTFMTEVLAIVRAHVTALGGNAMVAYFMTECVLNYNLHKNQIPMYQISNGECFLITEEPAAGVRQNHSIEVFMNLGLPDPQIT